MEYEIIQAIIAFITGGVLGAFVKAYFEFRRDVVSAIWEKRFGKYEKLWAITGVLPKWPKDEMVTYKQLFKTSESLRNWYFDEGGILLSKKSRIYYEHVQRALFKEAKIQTRDKITCEDYNRIRDLFSTLREQMTKDLTSRNRSLL